MKQVRGICISQCTMCVGCWGRDKHSPASKSSRPGALSSNWLHLITVFCHWSEWGCIWGNALWSLMQMLRWINLSWCLRWKQNAPKISIFVDIVLACYFENMKKPESFWCCDSHAVLKVALLFFFQNKKLIRGVQGFVQLWSHSSFEYGVSLQLWFCKDLIMFP